MLENTANKFIANIGEKYYFYKMDLELYRKMNINIDFCASIPYWGRGSSQLFLNCVA